MNKYPILALLLFCFSNIFAQATLSTGKKIEKNDKTVEKVVPTDVASAKKILFDIPELIPKKTNGKFGYVNKKGKFVIQPKYYVALFFAKDCSLLNSPNIKVRQYGTEEFATVEKNQVSYRIDKEGQEVYQYKDSDLGKCNKSFVKTKFQAYKRGGAYGLVYSNTSNFKIVPQYELVHVMESEELEYPMIVAVSGGKFGVVDINNVTIIPFEYEDIKRNFSWKLGRMFEVSKNGKDYYFIDAANRRY